MLTINKAWRNSHNHEAGSMKPLTLHKDFSSLNDEWINDKNRVIKEVIINKQLPANQQNLQLHVLQQHLYSTNVGVACKNR